ncbi:MAG: hypothetical protein ACTSO9_09880 [Candidatus Helarchaeota archaeon]
MKDLEKLFSKTSINWVDDNRTDVINSDVYKEFINIIPKLELVFNECLIKDKSEFERTLRHTFRLLIIYFQLNKGEYKHKSMGTHSILKIRNRIKKINQISSLYLPLILIFHDIGRPFNRKLHTYESAKVIKKLGLLDDFELNMKEKVLINKVIEYHLLIGTIYTGESSYYAITSLLNDSEFVKFLDDKEFINIFMLLSSTFTILDPLGYFYTQLFDHYIDYYFEIEEKLKKILLFWPDIDLIRKKLQKICFERIDWRLACALRIFQNVGTKPLLTYEYFIEKIKNSAEIYLNKKLNHEGWEEFKISCLSKIYLIQLKYALPVLMIIASGEFKRIFKPETVNTNLIDFWIHLNQKIDRENEKSKFKNENWNVIFDGLPHWSKFKGLFTKIMDRNRNRSIIESASVKFDDKRKENWLILNFNLDTPSKS